MLFVFVFDFVFVLFCGFVFAFVFVVIIWDCIVRPLLFTLVVGSLCYFCLNLYMYFYLHMYLNLCLYSLQVLFVDMIMLVFFRVFHLIIGHVPFVFGFDFVFSFVVFYICCH